MEGRRASLEEGLPALASLSLEGRAAVRLSRSVVAWNSVAKLPGQMVAGQRTAPRVEEIRGQGTTRWRAVPGPRDRRRLDAMTRPLSPATRGWPGDTSGGTPRLMPIGRPVRHFLDAAVNVLVRLHVKPPAGKS